jgi:carbon monoxide dehydrogenase subunit G
MPIQFQHSIDVKRTPAEAFAVLDDFEKTPTWVERCTKLEKPEGGPNTTGQKLKYSYRERGRSGVMDGEIQVHEPGKHLRMHYWDKMLDVVVDFQVAPADGGARLTHTIDITPKAFMVKLFSFAIRRQLPQQTVQTMENLRRLLEGGAS